MGMPEVNVAFEVLANTAVTRSSRGIVCVILKDTSVSGVYTYKKYKQVTQSYDEDNLAIIKQAFTDGVYKLVVCSVVETTAVIGSATVGSAAVGDDTTVTTTAEILNLLKNVKFNYLVSPYSDSDDNASIATWIKDMRANKKRVKAVLVNNVSNDKGLFNFTTEGIYVNNVAVTSGDFAVRIAVVLATTPLNQSATYHVFTDVTAITSKVDEDTCIDNGELILTFDGEKFKIARAVNSLTLLGTNEKASMKKAKIVDGMDLMADDVTTTFADEYTGKVDNNYDNKMLFCDAIGTYLDNIAKDGVLDKNATNEADINLETQTEYLEDTLGMDTSDMTEQAIREENTGSKVFAKINCTFCDAMEDLDLIVNM